MPSSRNVGTKTPRLRRRASGRRGRRAAVRSRRAWATAAGCTRSTEPMSIPSSSELVLTSARSSPAFSRCSSVEPALARQRSVVRQRDLLAGERVDARRHLLGLRAVVDEDERRARRRACARARAASTDGQIVAADVREVVDRRLDGELHAASPGRSRRSTGSTGRGLRAARACRSPSTLALDPRPRGTARSPPAASASPTDRCAAATVSARSLEPLERQREVRAALRARDRVDLVDDHRAHAAEHAAAAHGRQHDVQRLRRRDENVRRLAQHPRARRRRRVAGADGDANLGKRLAGRGEALAQLGERLLEVALDVVVERLERRDVEEVDRVRRAAPRVPSTISSFSSQRNAASVFPVPVGARMSVCDPRAIAGQPSRCGALGSPSVSRNQRRTSG